MNLLLGVGMLAAAVTLFAWIYGNTRSPAPPGWTRRDSVMIPVILVFTGSFTFGVGFTGVGLFSLGRELAELGFSGTAAVVLIAVGGAWLTRRLSTAHAGRRPQAGKPQPALGEVEPAKAA